MKKLSSVLLLVIFTTAVCHAVPYSTGFVEKPGLEYAGKKHFELQAFVVPVVFEVPAAPAVTYDLDVQVTAGITLPVDPHANSPPSEMNAHYSYSMAYWR